MKKRIQLFCLLFFLSLGSINAQTFLLNPAQGYFLDDPGDLKYKLLFSQTDSVVFSWLANLTGTNSKIKIGLSSGNYNIKSIAVSGSRAGYKANQTPLNLSTGRYYAIVTNSNATTLAQIQADFAASPTTIKYSNEIQFVIEAPIAPVALNPSGVITEATPDFEWTSVAGVPAYYLIVSSTPFNVVTLPSGEVSVEGANIIWNFITTGTSVQYGELDPLSPYYIPAPPLIPGNTYNYTILNLYDESDISFASTVFSGVTAFTFQGTQTLTPPILVYPPDGATFSSDEYINFQWDPVPNANSYSIFLYQRVSTFAGNNQQFDVPIWNSTVTSTSISYPAVTTLTKSDYVWFVIPNDNSGAGVASQTSLFHYIQPIGGFRITCIDAETGSNFTNFEVEVNSLSGGVSPANPIIVSNSQSFSDSLVVGTYEFTAKKPNYYDSTFVVTITENGFVIANLAVRPYPALISGSVKDQFNAAVNDALITLKNVATTEEFLVQTNSLGDFSAALPRGTYTVRATKNGYIPSSQRTVTVEGDQLIISPHLTLTLDNASISGKVLNDLGTPVQLATITATSGSVTQQVVTDGNGNYSITLNSGNWLISVSKSGFIPSEPQTISLITGDNLQNQNFILVPRANQITGFVYKVTSGGSTPFADVTVTAIPTSGTPVTTVSTNSGEYSLSLRAGSYNIVASQQGYTSSAPVQLTLTLGIAQTISGVNFDMIANPSSISGTVTGPDGAGISGVTVSTLSGVTGTTLPNGTYSISVSPGTRTLSAQKTGYVTPSSKQVSVLTGQNITGINFILSPNAATISGKVLNLQQPVVGATVTATSGTSSSSVTTNSNGEYTFNLQPGTYSLNALKTGFIGGATINVAVSGGQQSLNNNFNLDRNLATVRGTILSNSGNPINAVTVIAENTTNSSKIFSTLSSSDGSYSLGVEGGAAYKVTLTEQVYSSYTETTSVLNAGDTKTINATLTANLSTVSGVVKDNLQSPVISATVTLRNLGTGIVEKTITTQANGTFSSGINQGNYAIVARKDGHIRDSIVVSLSAGQTLSNLSLTLTQNFALMTGNITDAGGLPLDDAVLNLDGQYSATVTANETGVYLLTGIVGGTYSVKVSKPGYKDTILTSYVIAGGSSKSQNFILPQLTGKISGIISGASVGNVKQATVFAKSNTSNEVLAELSDDNGYFEFINLNFDSYTISASKTGMTSTAAVALTIGADNQQGTADISDFIAQSSKIKGTVVDGSGTPLGNVQITVSGLAGSGLATSSSNGTYIMTNLTPGNYTLSANKVGYTYGGATISLVDSFVLNPTLIRNTSTITGTVKNQIGEKLRIQTQVKAVSSGSESYTATVDANGNYSLTNVASGKQYTVFNDIYREGFDNDTSSITVPEGAPTAGPVNLQVQVNLSGIKGNAGTPTAHLKIQNISTSEIFTTSSTGTGSFEKLFLTNGSYRITPNKQGFTFSPTTTTVNLTVRDTQTVNFTASSQVGKANITVSESNGTKIAGVAISLTNAAGNTVLNGVTNAAGNVLISDIPSGAYTLRASKEGFSPLSPTTSVTISTGQTAESSVQMVRNTARLSGTVYKKSSTTSVPFPNVTVKLRYSTGVTLVGLTDAQGKYSLKDLPAGQAYVYAIQSGYTTDSLAVNLAIGATVARDVNLSAAFVAVRGKVLLEGVGLSNVNITATGSSVNSVKTDQNGQFSFPALTIQQGAGDSTLYNIAINDSRYPIKSIVRSFTAAEAGTTVTLGDFILPSGQMFITVTDGKSVLPGAKVILTRPNGVNRTEITGLNGVFTSKNELFKGTYRVSLEKEGYLGPTEEYTRVILNDDTSSVRVTFRMPYIFDTVDTIFADENTVIKVFSNLTDDIPVPTLYYRKSSDQEFTALGMTVSGDTISGTIPAQFSLEDIEYYLEIKNLTTGILNRSPHYTVTPLAKGILSALKIDPELNGLILRMGDTYQISAIIRDGIGNDLKDKFTGTSSPGKITWTSNDPDNLPITFPIASDSTISLLNADAAGEYSVTIETALNGVEQLRTLNLTVTDVPISSISLRVPQARIKNSSPGIQISLTGKDTLNRSVYLGSSAVWILDPIGAGTISRTGFFVPKDTTYIGRPVVSVFDEATGFNASTEFNVYSVVNSDKSYKLYNARGVEIFIQQGAVNFPIELSLTRPQAGPTKKQFTPIGERNTYRVSSDIYKIQYRGSVALSGDTLIKPASMILPVDKSLKFFDGKKYVGRYNPESKQWSLYKGSGSLGKTSLAASGLEVNTISAFGEYAVLSENEPLGIKHLAVLPSPFSPDVAPLKIGYFLTSPDRFATVTIKVYNVRGELVKTIFENDLQESGKYGTRTGIKEVTWDGSTDDGRLARNGRYIIQVLAKDSSGEKSELTQVVLVK